MLKEKDAAIRRAMMALDIMVISAAFFISYFFRVSFHSFYKFNVFPSRNIIRDVPGQFSEYLLILIIAAPLWCFLLHKNGMYSSWRTRKARNIIWIAFRASVMNFVILAATSFIFKLLSVSRLFFIAFALLGFFSLICEKIAVFSIMHMVRKRGRNYRLLLTVGTGRRAADVIKRIKAHPEWGFRILGAIDDEPGRGVESVDGVQIIGGLKDIPEILHNHAVDEVIFVVPRLRLSHIEKSIHDCEIEGVKVSIAVDLFDLEIAKSYQNWLEGIPLLTFRTTVPNESDLFIKRVIDIVISGICIFFFSPFLLILSIIIKLTSRGSVFYRQERIGLNGRRFTMFKFRTMYVGAEEKLSQVDIYREIYEPQWKKAKLQYVTPIGKFLRKFSLDEFPQLFNVFLGQMSLVGPRPTLPQEVKQYESWHRRRFSMRPGLTCLWQVNGRRKIELHEWMQMDLEYLDNWSLWLDFMILIKTIPAVLFGSGAY
jgi:exopolysaccharide biosynthesis polyprenyl glycosylphosphotransferase